MDDFLTALLMRFVYRSVCPTAEFVGGSMLLRYGKVLKAFVLVIWCIVLVVSFAAAAWPPRPNDVSIVLIVGAMSIVLNGLMTLEFFGVSVLYDESGIHTHSPWRANRSIAWSEITNVTYSELCQWCLINPINQGSVRCHLFLNGTGSLLRELKNRGFEIPRWAHPPMA